MVKVGIIGATGYAGAELIRILMGHPGVALHALGSSSQAGKAVSEIYPNFFGLNHMILLQPEQVISSCGVIFTSLPHGLSEGYAKQCKEQGKILIDLGAVKLIPVIEAGIGIVEEIGVVVIITARLHAQGRAAIFQKHRRI